MDDIQSSKGKSSEEKDKMMELLRKFEEDSLRRDEEWSGDEDGEGDTETSELEEKLRGVDLGRHWLHTSHCVCFPADHPHLADSLSPDALLALLSPAQLATFQSTLADRTKVSALVDAEFEPDLPWWEVPDADAPEERNEEGSDDGDSEDERLSAKPELVPPDSLPPLRKVDGKVAVSPKLVYNVVAVL